MENKKTPSKIKNTITLIICLGFIFGITKCTKNMKNSPEYRMNLMNKDASVKCRIEYRKATRLENDICPSCVSKKSKGNIIIVSINGKMKNGFGVMMEVPAVCYYDKTTKTITEFKIN